MMQYVGFRAARILGFHKAVHGAIRSMHSQGLWEDLLGQKLQPADAKKIEEEFLDYMCAHSLPSWLPFLPHSSFWIPSSEDTMGFLHLISNRLKNSRKPSTSSDSEVLLFEATDKLLYHSSLARLSADSAGGRLERSDDSNEESAEGDSDSDTTTPSEHTRKGT